MKDDLRPDSESSETGTGMDGEVPKEIGGSLILSISKNLKRPLMDEIKVCNIL